MEFLKDLPLITSFGQLFLILVGMWIAVKHILPHMKPGNGATATLAEIKTVVLLANDTLTEIAKTQTLMAQTLSELERRGRGQEEAIRHVLGRA